jgi:hypothetical protein
MQAMSLRKALLLAWIVALAPALGCTPDLRDVIQEHRAKVEPQLAKVKALREAAKSAPPVTKDGVKIDGPAPRLAIFDYGAYINAAIEYVEDLDEITELGNVPHRMTAAGSINQCASALATHREPYNPQVGGVPSEMYSYTARRLFEHCEAVQYLFVVKSLAFAAPSEVRSTLGPCPEPSPEDTGETAPDAGASTSGPADAGADSGARDGGAKPGKTIAVKSARLAVRDAGVDSGVEDGGANGADVTPTGTCLRFNGGYLRAEVLVFDVKSGGQLGGFRFVAESSRNVDVATASTSDAAVRSDFDTKIRAAFDEAAHKWVPSLVRRF